MAQPDDPVARLHNRVAADPDDVVASTRPPGTTAADLDRMVADVMAKLELGPDLRACEIGCGTGVLAVPLADRVARFVGVDFAAHALDVLAARLGSAGLGDRSTLVELDLIGARPDELAALADLGPFDRILVYATFHYVRDEAQAATLLGRVVELLAPGGVALVGNLPVVELAAELAPGRRSGRSARSGRVGQARALAAWVLHQPDPIGRYAALEGPGPGRDRRPSPPTPTRPAAPGRPRRRPRRAGGRHRPGPAPRRPRAPGGRPGHPHPAPLAGPGGGRAHVPRPGRPAHHPTAASVRSGRR